MRFAKPLHRLLAWVMLTGATAALRAESGGEEELVRAGREVYVAEGCIHCHSQFVRPGTVDVERWGPTHPLTEILQAAPPLLGNRRQGPDLANVGNRRTPEWNRLHLIAPRAISPGSRMPNYAHLFAAADPRGPALVAYLASLGDETHLARAETITTWQPDRAALHSADPARGLRLFAQLCANCHGPTGHGNGPLAAQLAQPPPDWREGWRRFAADLAPDALATELARTIKFGAPGTAMAGHETLTDHELAALVAHVRSLRAGSR